MNLERLKCKIRRRKLLKCPNGIGQRPSENSHHLPRLFLHGYGTGRCQDLSLHQQLASASGTQTIQLREELVLAVAQNASAQAMVFEPSSKIN